MPDPRPGQGAKRCFQSAGPVDSPAERILVQPAFQLAEDLPVAGGIVLHAARLRQQHQVLVPVQFPDDLVIARTLEIQVRDQPEVAQAGLHRVLVIAAPTDFRTCVYRYAQQRKPVFTDARRQAPCFHLKRRPTQPCRSRRRVGQLWQR